MNLEMPTELPSRITPDADWWRGAVIYQIYPRSYQDSNSDGIGDLAGIIHRLPYIASLGVDAIWISPFFTSPMLDFGYDVSDYRDVDPIFGTIGDFDALVHRAHELGLRVMIDLVLSHTSDQHVWFKESRSSHDNPKADWYVWADARADGTPPTNWLSVFGGSAWQWDGERRQYYLHNFLKEQPDLNFHTAEVQQALLDITRFWLDRGVDGFRLDTINFYFHDQDLRDNPALRPEERNATIAPDVNPYNFQDHLYDKNQPENLAFLQRFRAVLDEYPDTTAVGEVGDAQRGLEIIGQYTSGGDKVHMCYSFDFLSPDPMTGTRAAKVLEAFDAAAGDGWPCWAFSNHDVARHASRWGLGEAALRAHALLLLSLRGSVTLYQGEELGLTEAYIPFEELQDPYGIEFWPKFKGRDGCRTPMVWSPDAPNGGFTDAKPWLPVAMEHLPMSVLSQEDSAESLLAFYKTALALRKTHPALIRGSLEVVEATPGAIAFFRRLDGAKTVFCAINLSGETVSLPLPAGQWTVEAGLGFTAETQNGRLILPAYHGHIATQ